MRASAIPAVLLLALAACSSPGEEAPRPAQATTPAPENSTAVAVTCRDVNTQALVFTLAEAEALGGADKGAALRARVAAAYREFYESLRITAWDAPSSLLAALSEWAGASREVAEYVASTTPAAGVVVDYGPDLPRWRAAKEKAEKLCGHPLPGTPSPTPT